MQLLNETGQPYDFAVAGDPRTYADLAQPAGLAEIATYASGIGVTKNLLIPLHERRRTGHADHADDDAHANGLMVHSFTFRAENSFLPKDFQSSTDPGGVWRPGRRSATIP